MEERRGVALGLGVEPLRGAECLADRREGLLDVRLRAAPLLRGVLAGGRGDAGPGRLQLGELRHHRGGVALQPFSGGAHGEPRGGDGIGVDGEDGHGDPFVGGCVRR
ncbi:hypothetical protein MICRO8M_70149 [Microbacterium sp. 8M]|nr:hypothetical protein MICRO8M_70149 [Microbacterium sp. 8M]